MKSFENELSPEVFSKLLKPEPQWDYMAMAKEYMSGLGSVMSYVEKVTTGTKTRYLVGTPGRDYVMDELCYLSWREAYTKLVVTRMGNGTVAVNWGG